MSSKDEYYYYDWCSECGGEFESRPGFTFDTYPPSLPVRCKKCGNEEMAQPYEDCIIMGWKDNRERM